MVNRFTAFSGSLIPYPEQFRKPHKASNRSFVRKIAMSSTGLIISITAVIFVCGAAAVVLLLRLPG